MIAATAWVGSMWAVGYIAAPVLFHAIPDKVLAGNVAGQMFAVTAYAGMTCAALLLVYCKMLFGAAMFRRGVVWIILVMLALTLLGQFGIQPVLAGLKAQALPLPVMQSDFAAQFRLWHGISSMMFLLASLLGAVLLVKLHRAGGENNLQ